MQKKKFMVATRGKDFRYNEAHLFTNNLEEAKKKKAELNKQFNHRAEVAIFNWQDALGNYIYNPYYNREGDVL